MTYRFLRENYYPNHAEPVDGQGTDAACFTYARNEKLYAIAFHGKANKPDWHFQFNSEQNRATRIAEFIEGRRDRAEHMAQRKADRTKPHTLQLGEILISSWGYDQTNIDFYQVTKVFRMSVELTPIAQSNTEGGGPGTDMVLAVKDKFCGAPALHRVNADGNAVKVRSFAWAHPWSGSPAYQTAWGYGH